MYGQVSRSGKDLELGCRQKHVERPDAGGEVKLVASVEHDRAPCTMPACSACSHMSIQRVAGERVDGLGCI